MDTKEEYTSRRKKWAEALESGEYQQTTGHLKDGDRFCCLGVACDLYGKEKGVDWDPSSRIPVFLGTIGYLPKEVKDWYGLCTQSGAYIDRNNTSYYGYQSLMKLNDSGKTFAEIAEFIRSEPEGLFLNGT